MKECKNYFDEFIRKASNPYYADEKSDEECLIAALSIIRELEESNIRLDDLSEFIIYNNTAQMAIGTDNLDLAKEFINKAKKFEVTDFNYACLNWREAELYYKLGKKERSYSEYLSALSLYENAHYINPLYKPDVAKYNIWSIKNKIAKNFDSIDFSYKALKDVVELYKEGISSLADVRDTYNNFTKLCEDIDTIKLGVNLLKVNNIAL